MLKNNHSDLICLNYVFNNRNIGLISLPSKTKSFDHRRILHTHTHRENTWAKPWCCRWKQIQTPVVPLGFFDDDTQSGKHNNNDDEDNNRMAEGPRGSRSWCVVTRVRRREFNITVACFPGGWHVPCRRDTSAFIPVRGCVLERGEKRVIEVGIFREPKQNNLFFSLLENSLFENRYLKKAK